MASRWPGCEGPAGSAAGSQAVVLAVPFDEPRHALVDAGPRMKPVIAFDCADVGACFAHIADLHGLGVEQCLATGLMLQQLDNEIKVLAKFVADIVNSMRAGATTRLRFSVFNQLTF